MQYEFNMLYYLRILNKWKIAIALAVAIAAFLTMIISFSDPPLYASTLTLLFDQSTSTDSMSTVGRLFGLPVSSGFSSRTLIVAILKSKRMHDDISEQFNLKQQPNVRWSIETAEATSILRVNAKATDPALAEKIANFSIENLERINAELTLTSQKPLVKVLDPPEYGSRVPGSTSKKVLVAALLAFLLSSIVVFFSEYFKHLKEKEIVSENSHR